MTRKIRIKKIIPERLKQEFLDGKRKRGYCGISISNTFFRDVDKTTLFLNWIDTTFDEFLFFVDDVFHTYNEQAFTNKPKEECDRIAYENGLTIKANIEKVIASLNLHTHFEVKTSNEISQLDTFKHHLEDYIKLFNTNTEFKELLEVSAVDYVERQKKRGNIIIVTEDVATQLSCMYLVNEIAVFTTIVSDMGYTTEAYPGAEILFLEKIANKEFDATCIPDSFKNRINIEVGFRD